MKIVGILEKIVKMHKFLQKYIFLFCVYKMVEISGVSGGKNWLNEKAYRNKS